MGSNAPSSNHAECLGVSPERLFHDLIETLEKREPLSVEKSLGLPEGLEDRFACLYEMKFSLSRNASGERCQALSSDSAVFCDKEWRSVLHAYPKKWTLPNFPDAGVSVEQVVAYYEFVEKMRGTHEISIKSGKVPTQVQVSNLLSGKPRKTAKVEILPPPKLIDRPESGYVYSHVPFAEGVPYREAEWKYPGVVADILDIDEGVRRMAEIKGIKNPVDIGNVHHVNLRVVMSSDGSHVQKYVVTDLAERINA